MKVFDKIVLVCAATFAVMALNACGDDSSSGASDDDYSAVSDPESSSSIESSDHASSSSSAPTEDSASSSSVASSPSLEESSCSAESSSSKDVAGSSFGDVIASSSAKQSSSSSSSVKVTSSSDYASSSSSAPTEDPESSSSVASSSSEKLSSSLASSSSVSSSSLESSSSIESSSSVKDGSEYDAVAQTLTDLRDDQVYKTVKIGDQIWMAENLNFEYDEGAAGSFCYNNKADSCAKYGRLYLWSAAMDSAAVFSDDAEGCGFGTACASKETFRGLCPEGWHLPSTTEWETLFATVGGMDNAGKMLRSASGWIEECSDGEDAYGFKALPAGYRFNFGSFNDAGSMAYFWAGSESSDEKANIVYLNGYYDYAKQKSDYKNVASSVRCIKD